MRREDDDIAVWLVEFRGDLAAGVAVLGELGIGPQDARRTLAMVPLQLAVLSTGSANQVAAKLEAVGAKIELRRVRRLPRPTEASPPTFPHPSPLTPPPPRRESPWKAFRPLLLLVGIPCLLSGLYGGVEALLDFYDIRSDDRWLGLFASRSDVEIHRGYVEEMERHRSDPEAHALLQRVARGDADGVSAGLKGLTFFSHADLVAYWGIVHQTVGGAPGICDLPPEERAIRTLPNETLVELGRLSARAVAASAHERPLTSGHERALDEGFLFIYRRLAHREQRELEEHAKQADEGEPRAICLTLDAVLDGTEHMHADLQRRFLRALADSVARQHGAI